MLNKDGEEKSFIKDMKHEDIEHKRDVKAIRKSEYTQEIEESIEETVIRFL